MRCSGCGRVAGANETICSECGQTLVPADVAAITQSAPASPTAPSVPSATAGAADLPEEYAAALRSPTPPWSGATSTPPVPHHTQPWPKRAPAYPRVTALSALLNRQSVIVGVLVVLVVGGLLFTITNRPGGGVTALLPAAATATPQRTTSGEVILYHDALHASTRGWENQDGCRFHDDGLQVKDNFNCFVPIAKRNDMHVMVTVKQTTGPLDHWYGVGIRSSYDENSAYYIGYTFALNNTGRWTFATCTNDSHVCIPLAGKEAGLVMYVGLNQTNTIEVSAKGSHFDFWLNGTRLGSFDDTTYTFGKVDLNADEGIEAIYTNLTVSQPK